MSGILNSKSRVIDAILTIEGRRQMAEGTFDISYASFSDWGIPYLPDSENGHQDPTDKIYFEACSLPHDQITFEANDSGKIVPFRDQNIKLDYSLFPSSSGNFSVQGSIEDGELSVYRYFNGRNIKALGGIEKNNQYKDTGFYYKDSSGVSGSILLDSSLNSRQILVNTSTNPVKAYIGTKDGISVEEFVSLITGSVRLLSSSIGPKITCFSSGNTVYFDEQGIDSFNLPIFFTGSNSLSSKLILKESPIGGTLLKEEIVNASFATEIKGILTSSFDNFLEHQIIATKNRLFEDDQFEISSNEINFDVGYTSPSEVLALNFSPPTVNSIDSLFSDDKLSHLDNFLYLPPIVKASDAEIPDKSNLDLIKDYALANYPSWGDNEKKLTYSNLKKHVESYKDVKTPIVFTKTSVNNKLIGQMFEVSDRQVTKLDIVDFGEIKESSQDLSSDSKRIFFVGKTFIDDRGTTCFVNIFTLIFSNPNTDEAR
jgi:hypothetical protein